MVKSTYPRPEVLTNYFGILNLSGSPGSSCLPLGGVVVPHHLRLPHHLPNLTLSQHPSDTLLRTFLRLMRTVQLFKPSMRKESLRLTIYSSLNAISKMTPPFQTLSISTPASHSNTSMVPSYTFAKFLCPIPAQR